MIIENRNTKKRFEVTAQEWEVVSKGVNEYDIIDDDAPIEVKSMREKEVSKSKTKAKK